MKILFSHGGTIKLFQIEKESPDNYQAMRRFVQKNLSNVPSNFVIKYKDDDGDLIVIQSNKDIEALFDRKSTQYVRASIENEDQNEKESDQSQEDSVDQEEKGRDNRLNSDDENDKQIEEQNSDDKFGTLDLKPNFQAPFRENFSAFCQAPQNQMDQKNQTENPNIFLAQNQFVQSNKEKKTDSKPEASKKEDLLIDLSPTLPLKQQATNPRQNENQEELRYDEPQVFPPEMSKSRLATRISSQMNDQNVLRLIRSLFNTEFQLRLDALIPRLMEKIKKQVRVEFPYLLPQQVHMEQPAVEQVVFQASRPEILHEVSCNGCTKETIQGIRYKCLTCPEYNLCQDCEKVIDHQHNLLKMKFPEVKEFSTDKIIDPKLEFTNKCFFLTSFFGGEANDYKKFVQKHSEKTEHQIFEEYFKLNSKKLKKRMGQRLNEMTKKLGFYFEKDYLDFIDLVIQNPTESFEALVTLVKECGIESDESSQEESYSSNLNFSKTLKDSSKYESLKQSPLKHQTLDNRKTEKIEKSRSSKNQSFSQQNNQKEEFLYYVYTKYGIQPQKELDKAKFVINYFSKNENFLTLEGMKTAFCDEVEKSKRWKPTEYYELI